MKISIAPYFLAPLFAAAVAGPAYPQGRAAVVAQPLRTVQMQYEQIGPKNPDFARLWPDEARSIDPNPPSGQKPVVYVGHVREASGALLTVTMISAGEGCGPNSCPIQLQRNGKTIKKFSGCSEVSGHRISADGKFFMACDAQVPIPAN